MYGYDQPLLILPFDHRSSFVEGILGLSYPLSISQKTEVKHIKGIVYEAFLRVYQSDPFPEQLGVLIDEEFGTILLKQAKKKGIVTCLTTEKSGQKQFIFEYGNQFGKHLSLFAPTFAKALVRYHPKQDNELQLKRLKRLSEYVHGHDIKLLVELLIDSSIEKNKRVFSVVESIRQMQKAGVEADVWKLEGFDTVSDWNRVVTQAQYGASRRGVKCILLGRGENKTKVRQWVEVALKCSGVIGFAIGRTIFADTLKDYVKGKMTRRDAVIVMAEKFKGYVTLWRKRR